METHESQVALPLRSYTILGVCQGLGEDFGFNPNFIRVPLAATVLYSPLWAVGIYFALGALVLGSRLLFPSRVVSVAAPRQPSAAADEQPELAKAA